MRIRDFLFFVSWKLYVLLQNSGRSLMLMLLDFHIICVRSLVYFANLFWEYLDFSKKIDRVWLWVLNSESLKSYQLIISYFVFDLGIKTRTEDRISEDGAGNISCCKTFFSNFGAKCFLCLLIQLFWSLCLFSRKIVFSLFLSDL